MKKLMNEREQAKCFIEQCWKDSASYADTGEYCPKRVGAFMSFVEVDLMDALREISRLQKIAKCNDPGAVGLRPGESLASSVEVENKNQEDGAPDRIWLQFHGDAEPPFENLDRPSRWDISWCSEPIFKHDVEYIRADLADERERAIVEDASDEN